MRQSKVEPSPCCSPPAGACARNCPAEALSVDAGVGCADGIIRGALRGTDPACDCSDDSPGHCC